MSDGGAGGRTRITARALERVTEAVTAEAFGSPGNRVRVDLSDHDGALDVAVSTAIRTISLSRAMQEGRALERSGGSIVDRTAVAEDAIRTRVHQLTGYEVRQVFVHITGVTVRQEPRVR